jgi:acetoin utilization protein AcuC
MHNPVSDNLAAKSTESIRGVGSRATAIDSRRPLYIGSDVYRRAAFGSNHPLNIVRHSAVLDVVRMMGWLRDEDFVSTGPAPIARLLEFHDPDYVEALQYAESEGRVSPEIRRRYHIGTLENPLFEGLFERAATTVAGSIRAAEIASEGRTAFHPSGGTHHGRPDRASGFCYFNDPVFAIRTLLGNGQGRVLYVDLDAHHGDGVEAAFAEEPRVMTISVHEADRWPYTGAAGDRLHGNARNLPVPRGFNDTEFAYLLDNAILPLKERFEPDAVVLCCGADCLAGDPLSGMMLSNLALWDAVDRLVRPGEPGVVLGGGGYNPWTVTRYWAGLWARLNGYEIPPALPADVIDYMQTMDCDLVDEDEVESAWLTTMADCPYPGPVREAIKLTAETATAN